MTWDKQVLKERVKEALDVAFEDIYERERRSYTHRLSACDELGEVCFNLLHEQKEKPDVVIDPLTRQGIDFFKLNEWDIGNCVSYYNHPALKP